MGSLLKYLNYKCSGREGTRTIVKAQERVNSVYFRDLGWNPLGVT